MGFLSSTKARLVMVFCGVLGFLNVMYMLSLNRSDRNQLHSTVWYPMYLKARAIMLNPIVLISYVLILSVLLFWVSKQPKTQDEETAKLVVLAMVICSFVGLLIGWAFKL